MAESRLRICDRRPASSTVLIRGATASNAARMVAGLPEAQSITAATAYGVGVAAAGVDAPPADGVMPATGVNPPMLDGVEPALGVDTPPADGVEPALGVNMPPLGGVEPTLGVNAPPADGVVPALGVDTPPLDGVNPVLGVDIPPLDGVEAPLGAVDPPHATASMLMAPATSAIASTRRRVNRLIGSDPTADSLDMLRRCSICIE